MIYKKFASIPVELPRLAVLKRMGYNRHLTGMSESQQGVIDEFMAEAFELCQPAGRYVVLDIKENDGKQVSLAEGVVFASPSVAKLLKGSSQCILLAARISVDLVNYRDKLIARKNGVGALIYDAVGSEVVDACLPWMLKRVNQEFSRFGRKTTKRRYSAGYGDFALENQQYFYKILKLSELGVRLSESFIFSPEKTVTALAGLE